MRLLAILAITTLAYGQADPVSRSWNQPVEPFAIAGPLYYVGASEITSYLIATPRGHILIDGGFAETAPQILRNIARLGFKPTDVKYLLSSHAHLDHAGGLAALKRATGATFVASAREIPLLARGGRDDPQFRDRLPYEPIEADRAVGDGARITLGGITLTAHVTAGHTRGCTTWTTRVASGGRMLDVVFLCSPTVPSEYKLVNNPRYTDIVADYEAQFAFLRALHPDIFLASHGNFFDLAEKSAALRKHPARNPFVDPEGYAEFVAGAERRFRAALAEQRSAVAR